MRQFSRSQWEPDLWNVGLDLAATKPPAQAWAQEAALDEATRLAASVGATSLHPPKLKSLDPVRVAGSIAVDELIKIAKDLNCAWAREIISIIAKDEEAFNQWAAPQCGERGLDEYAFLHPPPPIRTLARFKVHLDELARSGVVNKWANTKSPPTLGVEYMGSVRYFPTPKDEKWMRAIFDTYAINLYGLDPPHFGLLSAPEMIDLIRALVGNNAPVWFVSGDQRHFFYQLKVDNKALRKWLWVLCDGQWYNLRMLPMGWRWAPVIAQSAFWMIVARVPPGESSLGLRIKDLTNVTPLRHLYGSMARTGSPRWD